MGPDDAENRKPMVSWGNETSAAPLSKRTLIPNDIEKV